jgi:hypothetical protein
MVPQYFGSLITGNYVATQQNSSDFSLMAGVDLPAFWETLKLRWWVIPAVIGVAVGFLWAQESDLQVEPSSYMISHTFEARDPSAVLAGVGLEPSSIRSFPDVNNQFLVLQSAAVREEISSQLGREISVNVSRSRPSFTLIDTLESDGESSFVFTSTGVPTYSFACIEPVKSDCEAAIEAYAQKAAELRRTALSVGLSDLRNVLQKVREVSSDPSIATKIAAIDALEQDLETPLVKISEFEEAIGGTISTVRRPTYTFGVIAGAILGFLIVLQLTYSDRRIRSIRQLVRITGDRHLIGHIASSKNTVNERRVAVSIASVLSKTNATMVRYIPLRLPLTSVDSLKRLALDAGATAVISIPFTELSVQELTKVSTSEVDVAVVRRNRDTRVDLAEVVAALERSGRTFAGVLLIDESR